MALIKCSECGKEISDKSKTCIHCGCPVENETKYYCEECGKEILKTDKVCSNCGCPIDNKISDDIIVVSKRDKSLEIFKKIYPKFFGFIILISIIVIFIMENSLPSDSNSRGNATLFGFLLVILPSILLLIRCNVIYNNAKKTNISLSKKELYGVIHKLFKVSSISFPIDKISSINTIKLFGKINGISIIPVSGVIQKAYFIDNGDEFRKAIISEIFNKERK